MISMLRKFNRKNRFIIFICIGIFHPLSGLYGSAGIECFEDAAILGAIGKIEWSYEPSPRALQGYCDRIGHVKIVATMEQMEDFLDRLEREEWVLGRSGVCYAKNDVLVFDFEFLHLFRAFDALSEYEKF